MAGGSVLHGQAPPAGDSIAGVLAAKYHLPALSIAVVQTGRPAWRWQVGTAVRTTRFRVGSLSKLFTVAIAGRRLAPGQLELDRPIASYLADLPAAYGALTLRQLAGHLAGVRHYGPAEYLNHIAYPTVSASLGVFLKDSLLSPPGSRYYYSSYGFNLLGAVLETAAGRSFQQLLRDEVLTPLRLDHTGLEPSGHLDSDEAPPSTLDSLRVSRPSVAQDLSDRWPSGGVVSSAEDLARFAIGVFTPGYLADSVRTLLLTPQHTTAGTATRVGLAWRIAQDSLGRTYVHHGGTSVGGRAFLLLYPDQGVAVALLANIEANFGEVEALAFARLALDPPPEEYRQLLPRR